MCLAEHLADNISYQQKHDFLVFKGVLQSFSMGLVFHLFTLEIFTVCILSDSSFPFFKMRKKEG